MAVKCLDVNEVFELTSVLDKDEPKTVFVCSNLPSVIVASLKDKFQEMTDENGKKSLTYNTRKIFEEAFKHGVKSAKNLTDAKGIPCELKTEKVFLYGRERICVSQNTLESIPQEVIEEIGFHIWDKQKFTEQEIKN